VSVAQGEWGWVVQILLNESEGELKESSCYSQYHCQQSGP